MADKSDQILNKLDKLTGLYDGLKQEFTLLNGAVSRIENEKLASIETSISRIEGKLEEHMRQPAHA